MGLDPYRELGSIKGEIGGTILILVIVVIALFINWLGG